MTLLELCGIAEHMYPYFCARCGAPWCEMFRVPDAEWDRYIQLDMRDKILCRRCYDWIVQRIDAAEKETKL